MTKDFKKQAASDSAFGQYGLGWMVGGVAIGLLIGAGMYALANKGNTPDTTANTPANISTTDAGGAANTQTSTAGTNPALVDSNGAASLQDSPATPNQPSEEAPGFSYHAVLPQLEIDVPLAVQVEQPPASSKPAADKKKEAAVPPPKEAEKKAAATNAQKAEDKKATPPPVNQAVPTGFNGFQIGSYKTKDQAAEMQNRLKKNGLNSRVEQATIQGATWFRVKIGPATSAEMLQKWQQTLSGMGISPMQVRM